MTPPVEFNPGDIDPGQIIEAVRSKRFLAADRAGIDLGEIGTWDPFLLREQRLLVPVDLQALYVPEGDAEPMVRLPMMLAGAGVQSAEESMPTPFTAGTPREPGVHLHWAMPDALLRGQMKEHADGAPNRLSLPLLPDRWVVLRIVAPIDGSRPVVTGWVLEAERAVAVPLDLWTEGGEASSGATPAGVALTSDQLTGTIGGSVVWASAYDAVLNRFAFHDPLTDLGDVAPQGVDEDNATYVVAGWWRDPASDPLDSARSSDSLDELLDRLRWRQMSDWGDARLMQYDAKTGDDLRHALGLTTTDRFDPGRPTLAFKAPQASPFTQSGFVPITDELTQPAELVAASQFVADSPIRYTTPPWHLRSTLLHGSVYGVPVRGAIVLDQRPDAKATQIALGQDNDDVLAALGSVPGTTAEQERDAERMLAAFTMQKLDRLDSADGLVEIEETEHATSFGSFPAGSAGTDRFAQRVQTGGLGGMNIGRTRLSEAAQVSNVHVFGLQDMPPGAARAQGGIFDASVTVSFTEKPTLAVLTEEAVYDRMRSKVGDLLSAIEPRVVDRPAARFTFPTDPVVGIRGAARSLRHGNDGRGSADGKLTCRWPSQVITEIQGIFSGTDLIPSLSNGSVPTEILLLAREAALQDPYHSRWMTLAAPPVQSQSLPAATVLNRLRAEGAMRFGTDGTYDGSTPAFGGSHLAEQRAISDELRRFSIVKGADPDLVGITAWGQPWVPLWLEWEVEVDGVDPDSLDDWRLDSLDLAPATPGTEADPTVEPQGGSRTIVGRSLLTAGAATTLRKAVLDYLQAEDERDKVASGEIDEATEQALRTLADAVAIVDISTATLDGVRDQLVGLPAIDGVRRPVAEGGGTLHPAPVQAPALLMAGHGVVTKARLLDAFGRTLDLPLDTVAVPARLQVPEKPGLLALTPRITRPSRWQFRLVDAATLVGSEGTEARVDQIDPTLQVNPVCGFLLPDHLDESLEVFGMDGSPVGELLHEAVSGGVTWEIAPLREGPADSGPLFDLAPAQKPLGQLAAGLVAADAAYREGQPNGVVHPGAESALSALLRAIDTTLWTVDTFASFGSEHVAGLVGRPIAVVRAQLRLELMPTDDLDLSDPARAAEWEEAIRELGAIAFPVRIGELTRTDDGVLGFFLDDDYSRFRLVDKAIAGSATEGGRNRGQLGIIGLTPQLPPLHPLDHPYIANTDDADTLALHLGQTVTLTILMHPASKAHLTSGILPRKALALARDWVGPGLAAIAPSLRTGPVLVETDLDDKKQVRLPKVSVFGTNQNFLWRDTPATWRSDAILAATQTALLPDQPAELREGWIRVAPDPGPEAATETQGGTA